MQNRGPTGNEDRHDQLRQEKRPVPTLWLGGALMLAVAIVVALTTLVLISNDDDDERLETTPLVEILESPEEYFGTTVVTAGNVDEILGEGVFTLASLETPVIVVDDEAMLEPLVENTEVFVRAEVVRFDQASLQERTGAELDAEGVDYERFEGGMALLAFAVSQTYDGANSDGIGSRNSRAGGTG